MHKADQPPVLLTTVVMCCARQRSSAPGLGRCTRPYSVSITDASDTAARSPSPTSRLQAGERVLIRGLNHQGAVSPAALVGLVRCLMLM